MGCTQTLQKPRKTRHCRNCTTTGHLVQQMSLVSMGYTLLPLLQNTTPLCSQCMKTGLVAPEIYQLCKMNMRPTLRQQRCQPRKSCMSRDSRRYPPYTPPCIWFRMGQVQSGMSLVQAPWLYPLELYNWWQHTNRY